ncbi:hypothetical protein V8D89_008333 [Ganoderma adspersum]
MTTHSTLPRRTLGTSAPTSPDMFHRPYPTVRTSAASSVSLDDDTPGSRPPSARSSPRLAPILTPLTAELPTINSPVTPTGATSESGSGPTVFGLPLKYVSLVTLAVQNAALSIVMHYSRVSIPAAELYSPATAVLLNEMLKGSISFVIAFLRVVYASDTSGLGPAGWFFALRRVCHEIFSPDCWKLSIPALLYVVQNSLQFVAISNLPVATFQVTYQMKILTTAAFSVALLRKRLSSSKWISLFLLAIGVGIVQLQTLATRQVPPNTHIGSAHESAPLHIHIMSPLKGFGAVTAACFTSGLAGVYFEMVLKNSKADLWVRNVQLSLFSLLPAILPLFFETHHPARGGLWANLLRNFGGWAWATVVIQVLGGLITALVIKYSDNILKGFATSLSIVLSFLASVALFGFHITPTFVTGSSIVLVSTWMYNQPPGKELVAITNVIPGKAGPPSFPGTPVERDAPILGQFPSEKKRASPFGSPRVFSSALGMTEKPEGDRFGETVETSRYLNAPYGSPFPSRTPSPVLAPPYPPHAPMSPNLGTQNSGRRQ